MHETTFGTHSIPLESYLSLDLHRFIYETKSFELNQLTDFISNNSYSKEFLNNLSYTFKDTELFLRALTHMSFSNELSRVSLKSNQRLEYLGDAILDLLIATELFNNFPEFQEGKLSKFRSALVLHK